MIQDSNHAWFYILELLPTLFLIIKNFNLSRTRFLVSRGTRVNLVLLSHV